MRALNDGRPEWTLTDHLIADLWKLTAQANSKEPKKVKDHPVRAEMQKEAQAAAREARVAQLRADYQRRKRLYGYR